MAAGEGGGSGATVVDNDEDVDGWLPFASAGALLPFGARSWGERGCWYCSDDEETF